MNHVILFRNSWIRSTAFRRKLLLTRVFFRAAASAMQERSASHPLGPRPHQNCQPDLEKRVPQQHGPGDRGRMSDVSPAELRERTKVLCIFKNDPYRHCTMKLAESRALLGEMETRGRIIREFQAAPVEATHALYHDAPNTGFSSSALVTHERRSRITRSLGECARS